MRRSALPVALLVAGAAAQNTTCAEGLYMLVARGTGEEEGTGITGELADEIADKIKGSKIEGLDYPATFTNPNYDVSEEDGVEEMKERITSYHSACPDGKIAILGYSQGGQITSDVFCGGSVEDFTNATALSSNLVKDSVVAIVMFGDPSHVANISYDRGTSIKDGIFKRENTSICEGYGDIIRSYCDTGDFYCDSGSDDDVHGSYIKRYGDEVLDFIVQRYENSTSNNGSGSSSSSSGTASATASTTTPTGSGSSASETSVPDDNAASGIAPGLVVLAPLVLMAFGLAI